MHFEWCLMSVYPKHKSLLHLDPSFFHLLVLQSRVHGVTWTSAKDVVQVLQVNKCLVPFRSQLRNWWLPPSYQVRFLSRTYLDVISLYVKVSSRITHRISVVFWMECLRFECYKSWTAMGVAASWLIFKSNSTACAIAAFSRLLRERGGGGRGSSLSAYALDNP